MEFHTIFAISFVMAKSRAVFKSDGIRDSPDRKPIEESKVTSLGAPPCPRSITVCSDLLSELPVIHKDRTLAPLYLGILRRKESQLATIFNKQPKTPTPQLNIPQDTQEKQVSTYPTNSPSSAAPLPHPHPLPSLSPSPSHSYSSHCRRQKTKASSGGGDETKRSSSPALRQSCGGMGYRKPKRLKKRSGGSARIAWWGCGLRVWGLRRS